MIVGAVCMSHSPLLDRNRAPADTEQRFNNALKRAADFAASLEPTLTVVFYPDHVNGFFYNLLPAFCIGVEGQSIGDYGTVAGKLNIPEALAMSCVTSVLAQGVDVALSYRMNVDHGAVQPIELLSSGRDLSRLIPVFINCAAAPRPTFPRVRALGAAVGAWARSCPERVLIVASGGLSHDPPVPALATATPEIRSALIEGNPLGFPQRMARQLRAHQLGHQLAAGTADILPLNPEWDRKMLDAFAAGDLTPLDNVDDEAITAASGRGAHEIRSWVAALAALGPNYRADVLFYEAINEWITGMGILTGKAA
jgi:2,3-dihydroxyphenylpropionate 1,2-dioxygenase